MQPAHCGCIRGQMDLDDMGYVYVNDAQGYNVNILDANGNTVARVGSYGNQDCAGPASRFRWPDVPFYVMRGVAVSGGKMFVSDYGNRRILKIDLGYRASKTVALKRGD